MKRALAVAGALIPSLVLADADARFARLRDQAEPVGGLGSFLEKYVGDCEPGAVECRQVAEAYRRKANGKKFYMIVTEESAGMISMGPYNPAGEFILNVTPFFGASGSAVTHGAPSRTDAEGNPILPYIRIKGITPEGGNAQSVSRWVSMRALRLQVVFTPQGTWTLNKKGGGKITGVRARMDAILLTVGRTGEQVGLWLASG